MLPAEQLNNGLIHESDIKNATILAIDDEEINLAILEEILISEGYKNILLSHDPVKGLELFEENSCDLVLLDLLMPKMNGFQVMERINQLDPTKSIPILILTALSDEETSLRALNSGARDFLVKPFNNQEALVRIRNLLEMRLAHKHLSRYSENLEREVRARTQEIESTQLEIIHRLGLAAEYRDNETGAHIIRMSHYSAEIGKKLGLNSAETDLILHAAPMHDIGKIGIPDNILLKPAKLTTEEFDIMKQHAVIGTGILSGSGSKLLQAAGNIALTHHEKWEGNGYPNGLKGTDIPLHGRITACADVFDALTSKRPYKTPWTLEKALEFMNETSGKHFDPDVVAAFLECMPEILKIKEVNDN